MSKIREIKPRTPEYIEDVPIGKSKKKDNKIYPRLRLEHEYFQEAKKWEV